MELTDLDSMEVARSGPYFSDSVVCVTHYSSRARRQYMWHQVHYRISLISTNLGGCFTPLITNNAMIFHSGYECINLFVDNTWVKKKQTPMRAIEGTQPR